jgi:DNA-binding transcriptional regulator YiaG
MTTKAAPLDIAELAAARFMSTSGEGKRIRLAARLSLSELAAAVGVTKASVCRWESGDMIPRGAHAAAYLAALRRIGGRL